MKKKPDGLMLLVIFFMLALLATSYAQSVLLPG